MNMYFIEWLLARIKRTLIGDGQWVWIRKYRELIMEEKPLSILLTLLCGLGWTLLCALFVLWLVDDKQLGFMIMRGVVFSVPLFYIYNWLMALYSIFDSERIAVWERLKE